MDILIGAGAGAVVAIGTWLTTFFLSKKKQDSTQTLSHNDQAFLVYKNIVDTIQGQFNQLMKNYNEMDKEFLLARELNASLKTENKFLLEEIAELRELNAKLQLK